VKIRYTDASKLDFDEAFEYYKSENLNLANRFKYHIKQSVRNIQSFPNLYPKIDNRVQKCVVSKFPYTIFYSIKNDTIFILAVANHYKNPNKYLSQIDNQT